jgi:mannose-6-phosphate isomerase-like protein (cupin superfamily)
MTTAAEELTGLSVADLSGPITTFDQLGGGGTVMNKALAIPVHLGGAWNSIEYVLVPPVTNGVGSSVGTHVQATDEIYFVHRGTGVLTTDGQPSAVGPGFLAVAPSGTQHSIRNESHQEPLGFLVIELKVPDSTAVRKPAEIASLPALLSDIAGGSHPAVSTPASNSLRMALVDLSSYFSAPWGGLALFEVPVGGRIDEYRDMEHDENIFVVSGAATIMVGGLPFVADDRGLNILVPRGVRHAIVNESAAAPLTILSVLVRSEGPRVAS